MAATIDFGLIRDPQLLDLIDDEWAADRLPDDGAGAWPARKAWWWWCVWVCGWVGGGGTTLPPRALLWQPLTPPVLPPRLRPGWRRHPAARLGAGAGGGGGGGGQASAARALDGARPAERGLTRRPWGRGARAPAGLRALPRRPAPQRCCCLYRRPACHAPPHHRQPHLPPRYPNPPPTRRACESLRPSHPHRLHEKNRRAPQPAAGGSRAGAARCWRARRCPLLAGTVVAGGKGHQPSRG